MKEKLKAMAWPDAMRESEYFCNGLNTLCCLSDRRWSVDKLDKPTTTRLASCRIDRWTLKPPEEA